MAAGALACSGARARCCTAKCINLTPGPGVAAPHAARRTPAHWLPRAAYYNDAVAIRRLAATLSGEELLQLDTQGNNVSVCACLARVCEGGGSRAARAARASEAASEAHCCSLAASACANSRRSMQLAEI